LSRFREFSREIATYLSTTKGEKRPFFKPVDAGGPWNSSCKRLRAGGTMIRIAVTYDAASQTFKLVDLNFDTLAEGDALFDLNLPLMSEDAESAFIVHA
jgi:hypothetical protein